MGVSNSPRQADFAIIASMRVVITIPKQSGGNPATVLVADLGDSSKIWAVI